MQSQICITGGNFWKNCSLWKVLLQPSKPRRGRELTKDRPYVCMYVGLCKFCQGDDAEVSLDEVPDDLAQGAWQGNAMP